jgi:glycosyltransferase involved in cell wall biosynthesis
MTDLAVIMSVYHNDKITFLKESVQSILDQTFTQFHYYIIFDGPVPYDIETYVDGLKDNRIKLFRLEKNGGLASALNFLLEITLRNPEYKLIARMDADDISMPSRFEKQHKFLMDNPDICVIGSWYEEIDETSNHLTYRKLPTGHDALRNRYYARTPFAHASVMYRRQLIEKVGFYSTDTIFMEDNVLWGKALKAEIKFANIPEYLLKFRIDKNFYNRRSGVRYGWNYIITRFKLNKTLESPFIGYFYTFCIGIIKMMPSFILRYYYILSKKLQ